MIAMFAARRPKSRARKQFRPGWDAGDAMPPGFQRGSYARNLRVQHELLDTVET